MNMLSKFRSTRRWPKIVVGVLLVGAIWILWSNKDNRQPLHPPKLTETSSQSCIELRPGNETYQEAVIWAPGLYCVITDFWQQRLYGAGHSGPGTYRSLVNLRGSDVTIDLKNRTLHSDGHSGGIKAYVQQNYSGAKSLNMHFGLHTTNILIKNGVIDLRGLGTGVILINKWGITSVEEPVPEGQNGYQKSNFVLENLLIKTDNVGIILEGDGNIIRNCIIESGGNAAVMMAGPNGQIINNTIVLTDPLIPGSMRGVRLGNIEDRHFGQFMKERKVPRAAIALHQATGTVISGNRIEVIGKSARRHNIYLADGSKNVRIEGNTFVGTDDPVTLVKGSTAILKDNALEQRKPWWKF